MAKSSAYAILAAVLVKDLRLVILHVVIVVLVKFKVIQPYYKMYVRFRSDNEPGDF